MADPPPRPKSAGTTSDASPGVVDSDRPSTPRWVKFVAAIGLVLLVLVVVVLVGGRGEHGPGRHSEPDGSGGQTAPSGTGGGGGGHKPPAGGH